MQSTVLLSQRGVEDASMTVAPVVVKPAIDSNRE